MRSVLLGGLEPPFLAPEANALSTELQERDADFTINMEPAFLGNRAVLSIYDCLENNLFLLVNLLIDYCLNAKLNTPLQRMDCSDV